MSRKPCRKKAARVISACINCEEAVLKKSNVERVYSRQLKLVNEMVAEQHGEFEIKQEKAELNTLEKMFKLVSEVQ